MSTKPKVTRPPLKSKEFRADVKAIYNSINELVTLAAIVGREGTFKMKLPGHKEETAIGAQEIRSWTSQIRAELVNLAKEYTNALQKKPRRAKRAGSAPNLSYITDAYRDFWRGANLGLVYPGQAQSADNVPVNTQLPFLTEQGITSSALLQSAWATYIDVNDLKDKDDTLLLRTDDYMNRKLKTTLDWLEKNTPTPEQEKRYKAKVAAGKEPNPPERFNRNSFKRYWLAVIGSFYTVPRIGNQPSPQQILAGNTTALTAEEEQALRDEANRQAVQEEINLLKEVRERWNEITGTGKSGKKGKGKARAEEEEEEEEEEDEEEQTLSGQDDDFNDEEDDDFGENQ
jgi:hypothetical protein